MTEVPGTDRDQARDDVLRETPLVPEDLEDAGDDPRATDEPDHRGDEGRTAEGVEPGPGSPDPGT